MRHHLTATQLEELRNTPIGEGANRVAKAIDLAKVTQADIATATGLAQPYVSDVARCRYPNITVVNASKFADMFGCQIEDLFPSRAVTAPAATPAAEAL